MAKTNKISSGEQGKYSELNVATPSNSSDNSSSDSVNPLRRKQLLYLNPTEDDQVSDDTPVLENLKPEETSEPVNDIASYVRRGLRSFFGFLKNKPSETAPSEIPTTPAAPDRNSLRRDTGNVSLSDTAINDWQNILYTHAKLNSSGKPVDETGKEINLRDMNTKFGQQLAQTALDLDAAGYKGQYYILSGVRTHDEQAGLYNHYKNIGSNHPVALPGHSPHEWGVATDLQYTGRGNADNFYAALHAHGRNNGMEFVANDINHVQIASAHQVIAELRQARSETQVAGMTQRSLPHAAVST